MEDFNENKNYQANSQNSWEELSEIDPNLERQKEIEQIKNKISELEQQDEENSGTDSRSFKTYSRG